MSRKSLKLATAVALTAGMVVSASACSSSSKSPSTNPTTQVQSHANDINPVDAATLKQGGVLNFPVDQYSTQWNNLQADSQNELSIFDTLGPMMPSLWHASADNKLSPNTDFLTSATVATVGGKQVTTYELNPKGKWSDGTPISWKDFQAIWQADNGVNTKYNPYATTGYSQIESVAQGKDQFEVVVTYKTPFADWQSLFSTLFPASQIGTVDGFNNSYKGKIPVTGGPYKLQKMDATTKVVTEVRDPNWWGTKPVLDTINFRTLTPDATPGAFASGEIDLMDIGPDTAAYKKAKSVSNTTIHVSGGWALRHAVINGKSPFFSDKTVRQAVFEAINRDAVGKSDLAGLPWPIAPLNNHFFVNNQAGYQDTAGPLGQYNVADAKAKLDAAGWKVGSDGIRAKDGKQFVINMEIPAGVAVATNESQLFTSMLQAVGIKVTVTQGQGDAFFNDLTAGKFDLTVFSGIGVAPIFTLSNQEASFLNPTAQGIGANFSRIGSPEIDAAMNKAGNDTDFTQYNADINAADKMIWDLGVDLPLYQRPQIVATKSALANYGAFGFQDIDWTKIGFTK
ncbi:ABC transporter family substrate-binding protein [Streptacidiphilus rugosus]|uniref:ABC transporter family substrate-binding protein n=1 Tax=Streptacidiphilus rugosus TaxID=405783 RepID=UPI00068F1850|nr:ABC transporter family substrate-binding protein [Streptacidiphilus rugosus]